MSRERSKDAQASLEDDSTDDAILRRIARAPARPPPSDPAYLSRFRILGRLGAGGMGVVYRAKDESLGREVAVKVMSPALEESPGRRRRLVIEARAAAALNHPNVATVYEVGEAEGRVFIAMELVVGESLRQRLSRAPMSTAEAERVARQILRGLSCAHEHGVVHRDLKPDNVMLGPSGSVKLLDFGLAKLEGPKSEPDPHATEDGKVLGTPGYMSPEQARGLRVDARSDVFAFGTVLYEMLAGVRPFQGDTPVDVIASIVRDTPARLHDRDPSIPLALDRIVMRCLEKAPDARYDSAQSVLGDLDGALPLSLPGQGQTRWLGGWAALLAVGVALAVVASVVHAPSHAPRPAPIASESPPPSPPVSRELAQAVLAVREGNREEDVRRFEALVAKYPDSSAAHLHLAIAHVTLGAERAAAEYRTAFEGRASLDAYDADLLQAFEPRFHVPWDLEEHVRRLQSLTDRYTEDPFLYEHTGQILFLLGRRPEALAAFDRAIGIDPGYVPAIAGKVRYLMDVDASASRALADACVAGSPEARMCLEERWHLSVDDGRCEDAEADTRRIRALDPTSPDVYFALAQEMVAQGEPLSAVEEALSRYSSLLPDPETRFVAERWDDSRVLVLRGDFSAARKKLEEVVTYGAAHPSVSREDAELERLDILYETGDEAASAREFERARAELRLSTSEAATESSVALALFELHAGRADRATLRRREDELFQKDVKREAAFVAWSTTYAAPVLDEADARDALLALRAHAIEVDPLALRHTDAARFLGKVYALTGQSREAIPLLERATRSCHPFQDVLETIRASYWLGMAREAVLDQKGAKDAYAAVLARWGAARPRSVFAERAREGLKRVSR